MKHYVLINRFPMFDDHPIKDREIAPMTRHLPPDTTSANDSPIVNDEIEIPAIGNLQSDEIQNPRQYMP